MKKTILSKYLAMAALTSLSLGAGATKHAFDGTAMLPSANSAALAQQSQPFVVSVANSGTATANVDIWGAWEYENNAGFTAGGNLVIGTITISSGVAGTTYRQLLKQSVTNQFVIGLTLIYSTAGAASQVFAPLTLTKSLGNGVANSSPIIPVPDPSQNLSNVTRVITPFQIDGATKITISSVAANATVLFFFYPAAATDPGNALKGLPTDQQFQAPPTLVKSIQ